MIKNIIFDMGNVLINFSPRRYVEMLGLENEEDKKLLFNAVFANNMCPYLDRGDYTEEAFVNEVNKNLPEKFHSLVHRLIFNWADEISPVSGMAEFVKEVKEKGYKIYLLSNAGYRQHEYWIRIPGHEYFDGSVVSCDVGMVKPEKRIYEALFKKFDLKPEECFFVDDLPINIYGANEAGMKGFVFHGDVKELRDYFIKNGML